MECGLLMTSFTLKHFGWANAGCGGQSCVPVERELVAGKIYCFRNVSAAVPASFPVEYRVLNTTGEGLGL